MGYRRRAGGGKRDAAEKAIREALDAAGRPSWQLGGTGNPDLLIWSPTPFVAVRGYWLPVEIKTGKAGLTPNQQDIRWPVLRSVDEALQAIGASR